MTIWIKWSDWLTIRSGRGILIYSAWQGLTGCILDSQGCKSFFVWIIRTLIGLHRCIGWFESSLGKHVTRYIFSTIQLLWLWFLPWFLYIATDKVFFSSENCWYLSYFSMKTCCRYSLGAPHICCRYSLEAPHRGASNEYPQHMFSLRNKKNIMWIPPLICSYDWYMYCKQI